MCFNVYSVSINKLNEFHTLFANEEGKIAFHNDIKFAMHLLRTLSDAAYSCFAKAYLTLENHDSIEKTYAVYEQQVKNSPNNLVIDTFNI